MYIDPIGQQGLAQFHSDTFVPGEFGVLVPDESAA
jgi:hypothetical protein